MFGPQPNLVDCTDLRQVRRATGEPLYRLEMEQYIRDNLGPHQLRHVSIRSFGLTRKQGFDMLPISVVHWVLDQLVTENLVIGEKLGVMPGADADQSEFSRFQQRLAEMIQTGQALMPKEGDGVEMTEINKFQPPPGGQPQQPNGQGAFAPPQQGFQPPQGMMQGPPQGGLPPGMMQGQMPPQQQAPQGYQQQPMQSQQPMGGMPPQGYPGQQMPGQMVPQQQQPFQQPQGIPQGGPPPGYPMPGQMPPQNAPQQMAPGGALGVPGMQPGGMPPGMTPGLPPQQMQPQGVSQMMPQQSFSPGLPPGMGMQGPPPQQMQPQQTQFPAQQMQPQPGQVTPQQDKNPRGRKKDASPQQMQPGQQPAGFPADTSGLQAELQSLRALAEDMNRRQKLVEFVTGINFLKDAHGNVSSEAYHALTQGGLAGALQFMRFPVPQ